MENEEFTEEKKEQMRIDLEQIKKRTYLVWFFTFLGLVFITICLFLKEQEAKLQAQRSLK